MSTGPISPVAYAFPHIQWDALGALRLSAQETALLRYVESNPIDYAVAEAQDASNYARVLLKLLAEACAAGAGTGKSKICRNFGMKKYVIEISLSFSSPIILSATRRSFNLYRKMRRGKGNASLRLGSSRCCHSLRIVKAQ